MAADLFQPRVVAPLPEQQPQSPPSTAAVQLPILKMLLVLGAVGTCYAAALLIWGDATASSLAPLWSWAGVQATALCGLNYVLRGWRWRMWMAHYGRHFGRWQGLRLYVAGYAFTPTPGNVGEAVRGLMLAREPLSAAQGLAIFGAERLADLLCLLLLCVPALLWGMSQGWGPMVLAAVGAVATVSMVGALLMGAAALAVMGLGLWAVARARPLARVGWLAEAWGCLALRPAAWISLTLVAWAAQGAALWLLCRAVGVDLPVLLASGFYALAMVAGAVSVLPAGLGGTEAALTGLLVVFGVSAALALAVTVTARMLTLWLAVGLGVVALVYSAAIAKDIRFS